MGWQAGLQIGLGGLQALGSFMAYRSEARQAEYNAQAAAMEAEQARKIGRLREYQSRKESSAILAKQQAGYGASGLVTDTGTPLAVFVESTKQAELDALLARFSGQQSAWQSLAERNLYKARASAYRRASYLGAIQGLGSGIERSGILV